MANEKFVFFFNLKNILSRFLIANEKFVFFFLKLKEHSFKISSTNNSVYLIYVSALRLENFRLNLYSLFKLLWALNN